MENAGVRVLELNLALSSHNQSVSYQNILSSDWLHVKSFFPPIGPCNYSGQWCYDIQSKSARKVL